MRERLLKFFLKNIPDGDLKNLLPENEYKISCVFIFYKHFNLMSNILHCLNTQAFDKKQFEIILVEDKGGSEQGRSFTKTFNEMNIRYFAPENGWGKMGFMRNYGLSKVKGEIVLFLDDDTVILDNNFLVRLYDLFDSDNSLQAVTPKGSASYSLILDRYSFHDPYFFSNRCMAYRKSCLVRLKGFDDTFAGQEDVEFAIRFIAKGFKSAKAGQLKFYHPPLFYNDTSKGYAVGASFAGSKYSPLMKLLLLINGARWIPLFFLPGAKNKFMALFSLGFAEGFIRHIFKKGKKAEYV